MSFFPLDGHYDGHDEVRVWEGTSRVIQENFRARGAVGVEVTAWSRKDDTPYVKRVILDSAVFQSVELSLEQVNLILCHLQANASTELVFVMAQAIEAGIDIDLVYDTATGRLKVPQAARKSPLMAEVAA